MAPAPFQSARTHKRNAWPFGENSKIRRNPNQNSTTFAGEPARYEYFHGDKEFATPAATRPWCVLAKSGLPNEKLVELFD